MNSICAMVLCLFLTGSSVLSVKYNAAQTPVAKYKYTIMTDSTGSKSIKSVITCPVCGYKKEEKVPTDHCLIRYTCTHCHKSLTPKKGDCCVFCSYGTVKCPTGK